jgi:hypothetical protein
VEPGIKHVREMGCDEDIEICVKYGKKRRIRYRRDLVSD